MDVQEQPDGTLVVSHDGTRLAWWLLNGALLLAGLALNEWFDDDRDHDRLVGCVGGAVTLFAVGLGCFERSRFAIDPRRRVIEWRRRFAWRTREGTVAFDDVQHVLVERPIGDDGAPSRRVCLRLVDGTTLPLRASYVADADGAVVRLAEKIRALLGRAPRPPVAESVQVLVEQGRTIEAVKLLREEKELTLTEAVSEVDEVKARLR